MDDISLIFSALKFAAGKHTKQRRKGSDDIPYINHPIEVAELLAGVAEVRDASTLAAAILHDTVEDTDTTPTEIEQLFGPEIRSLVMECTDDKTLTKDERKARQVSSAPHKTDQAKLIKLADKTNNLKDLAINPPSTWSLERRRNYINWSEQVVAGLKGQNKHLDEKYAEMLQKARERLEEDQKREQS
jgi:guanosine-3',5'-bis(diphosphate) 3'-pyrophosphohydrolase